jgi:hypothetical protein
VFANPNPGIAARTGLAGVALVTLAMGLTTDLQWWLVWRFLAGVASAVVLVGISAWTMQQLARTDRAHWAGWVFAGVGVGIVVAGLLSLVIGVRGTGPAAGWLLLGRICNAGARVDLEAILRIASHCQSSAPVHSQRFDADAWLLIGCYGIFGFGYIIPATFLPSLARQLLADPAVFGWTWPLFGFAAAVSTDCRVAAAAQRRAASGLGGMPRHHRGGRGGPRDGSERRHAVVCGDRHRRHVHGIDDSRHAGSAAGRGERCATSDGGDDRCVRHGPVARPDRRERPFFERIRALRTKRRRRGVVNCGRGDSVRVVPAA